MPGAKYAPDGKQILSVSGLLEAGRSLLDAEIGPVWVEAEVFEYRGPHAGSGHRYFKLRDHHATLNTILWRGSAAQALCCELREGQQVLVRGRFDIYAARGSLSFVLDHVEDRGAGGLAQRFEELKARLLAEGLFAKERKKKLPQYASRVVLITARNSAAEADALHVFQGCKTPLHLLLRYASVQGNTAVSDLVAALEDAVSVYPDLILLSRGGGSLEDLWAFNEEALVRAVASCPVPVLSAVGHEVDFTLCDFVADERAITPTAGAQRIVAPWLEGIDAMASLGHRILHQAKHFLEPPKQGFHHAMRRLLAQEPAQRLARQRLRCGHVEQRLLAAGEQMLDLGRHKLQAKANALLFASPEGPLRLRGAMLEKASARIEAANPEALLERGYALVVVEGQDVELGRKQFLRDPAAAPSQSVLRIQLARGKLRARVE